MVLLRRREEVALVPIEGHSSEKKGIGRWVKRLLHLITIS